MSRTAWTAEQLVDAFPHDTAPRWLLRDRDAIYGERFCHRVAGMRITEVVSAPSSPWQNPYVERLIGSIRRECLDHVIVLSEAHLRRVLARYLTPTIIGHGRIWRWPKMRHIHGPLNRRHGVTSVAIAEVGDPPSPVRAARRLTHQPAA